MFRLQEVPAGQDFNLTTHDFHAECVVDAGREQGVHQVPGGRSLFLRLAGKRQSSRRPAESERSARRLHLRAAPGNPWWENPEKISV